MTIYDWFCYYICGLPEGVHISDYLWEQKRRLGWMWWIFPITTILSTVALLALEVWLVFHIVFYKGTKYALAGFKGHGALAGQYQQDVEGIAGRYLDGKDELVAKNLKAWAEDYDVDPVAMWADVLIILKSWLSSQQRLYAHILKEKERGKTTFYKFGWGLLPIDEAVAKQKARLERCENPVMKGKRSAKR